MKHIELIVWNVRSRHNVGSFFRTSDAAGVSEIHLCGITPAPPHSRIEKVSLGAEKTIPHTSHAQISPLLKKLKKREYTLVALELTKTSIPYTSFKPKNNNPIALIVGSEVHGLSKQILTLSDVQIHIPMNGQKESLNVSVAFGIAIYRLMFP